VETAGPIYILGAGAIGFPLAVYLADAGRTVVAVRTSRADLPRGTVQVSVESGAAHVSAAVEMVSLAGLDRLDGIIVVAAKAYANEAIARALAERSARGPLVIMQNGVGVERPFLAAGFPEVYRCVLYFTGQTAGEQRFTVRAVAASPIGVVRGDADGLRRCVAALSTGGFPVRAEANIQREVWKKAITNVVFNSVCPLLDVDNGVFTRDPAAADLARELVAECVALTDRLGVGLGAAEVLEQVQTISARSAGQLISTLQDIRAGRPTEIDSLNLEFARVAASLQPPLALPRVELLGRLIALKSAPRGERQP